MFANFIFSGMFQAEGSFSSGGGLSISKGEGTTAGKGNFTDIFRKFQEGDLNFLKTENQGLSESILKENSNEKVISLIVDHMKEILRNMSQESSFVNFQSQDFASLKKMIFLSGKFSTDDIDSLLSSAKSGTDQYLPDLMGILDKFSTDDINMDDIYLPLSFVPYMETALLSLKMDMEDVKNIVEESSSDTEKGFSLGSFLEALNSVKGEVENELTSSDLDEDDQEELTGMLNGMNMLISFFSQDNGSAEETAPVSTFDKKTILSILSDMDSRIATEKKGSKYYKDMLELGSDKKESDFVLKTISSEESSVNQTNFVESLKSIEPALGEINQNMNMLSWRRRQRLLQELGNEGLNEKIQTEHFEESPQFKFFSSISSIEMDLKNYFSYGEKKLEDMDFEKIFEESDMGEDPFDLSSLLEKNTDKKSKDAFKSLLKHDSSETGPLNSVRSNASSAQSGSPQPVQKEGRFQLQRQVLNQVEKQFLRTVRTGIKDISFRLDPPDLGKMHLKVESVRNGLNIKILTEKSSTHEIMHQQAQEFKNQLISQGFQVAEVNVEFTNDFDQAMARERKNGSRDQNSSKKTVKIKNEESIAGNIPAGRPSALHLPGIGSLDLMA